MSHIDHEHNTHSCRDRESKRGVCVGARAHAIVHVLEQALWQRHKIRVNRAWWMNKCQLSRCCFSCSSKPGTVSFSCSLICFANPTGAPSRGQKSPLSLSPCFLKWNPLSFLRPHLTTELSKPNQPDSTRFPEKSEYIYFFLRCFLHDRGQSAVSHDPPYLSSEAPRGQERRFCWSVGAGLRIIRPPDSHQLRAAWLSAERSDGGVGPSEALTWQCKHTTTAGGSDENTSAQKKMDLNHRKNNLNLQLIKHWCNSSFRMLVFVMLAPDVRVFTDKTFEINSQKAPYRFFSSGVECLWTNCPRL